MPTKESIRHEHYLVCEAPICNCDENPNYKKEEVWRPGEKICLRSPYEKFQKMQFKINAEVEKGKFRDMDEIYTAYDLETKSI